MAVTSKDIANICGFSQGTVDRALNNRPGISPKTREYILETAQKLGYRPHLLARSLAKGSTMTLGLVVFDLRNRFFAQLVNAIEINARSHGYFVYLTLTNKDPEVEKSCIEHLVSRQVDGLILSSVQHGHESIEYLKQLKIPLVTVANRISEEFAFAGIDDYAAMKEATGYILGKGYERVLYVSPPLSYRGKSNIYAQEQRLKGYLDALKESERGLQPLVIENKDYLSRLNAEKVGNKARTAILCSNDVYMLEILNHFEARGIRVPEDVGIMGFDHIDVLKYVRPRPSTVAYPMEELGAKALECLLAQIQGNSRPADVILQHRIMEGESV